VLAPPPLDRAFALGGPPPLHPPAQRPYGYPYGILGAKEDQAKMTEHEIHQVLFDAHVREAKADIDVAYADMQGDFPDHTDTDLRHAAVAAVTESGEYPTAVANEARRREGLDPLPGTDPDADEAALHRGPSGSWERWRDEAEEAWEYNTEEMNR
jgi:hypothetical protein